MPRRRERRTLIAYLLAIALVLTWIPVETTESRTEIRYRSHFDLKTGTLQRTEHPETVVSTTPSWDFSWRALGSPRVSARWFLYLELGGVTALFGLIWVFGSASRRDPV